jgi:alkanesulfonate monooxygenase SsuD/methylene tetrahydromethanopterin reductase-like flavin-dependent oxidoreductase (luciferase family)
VKVSLALPQRLGAELIEVARLVERLGFDGVFCFDHLVPTADPRAPATEAVAALGSIAAATDRARVGSLVLRAGLRPGFVVAGIAATLAMVAPGRAVVGLGIGDRSSEPEAARFGSTVGPVAERAVLLAEAVDAARDTGVEVWVGGRHPSVRDVALRADALNLWEVHPDDLPSVPIPLTWGGRVAPAGGRPDVLLDGPDGIDAGLRLLRAAGVGEVVLTPVGSFDWDRLASLVVDA